MGNVSGLFDGLYIQTFTGAGRRSSKEEKENDYFPFCSAGDCDLAVSAKKKITPHSTAKRINRLWCVAS